MHKYASATALAIVLNITITPAVSADCFPVRSPLPRNEAECDRSDWGRTYAIRCHCSFECRRQYQREDEFLIKRTAGDINLGSRTASL
jgi:hypothetical protein